MKKQRGMRLILPSLSCMIAAVLIVPVTAATTADFNGDGKGDLAIGVPYESVNGVGLAGAVNVIYGSGTGLSSSGNQVLTQGLACGETPETADYFGAVLTTGDFNNDGYSDLVVGVSFENLGGTDMAGIVHVFYGSSSGLKCANAQLFDQFSLGLGLHYGDEFGAALATGDFDKDGYADLAIGTPGDHVQLAGFDHGGAGSVTVLYGTSEGLAPGTAELWTLSNALSESSHENDAFGSSLAVGNFGGTAHADLAIGIPGRDLWSGRPDGGGLVPAYQAGAVAIIYGSNSRLSPNLNNPNLNKVWTQNRVLGIATAATGGEFFGRALAAGNFGKTPEDDLAIGVPGENHQGGVVHILYGSGAGLTNVGNQTWRIAAPAPLDRYGSALVAANFGHGAYADLAIGAPMDDVGNFKDAGSVHVLYGTSAGLSLANRKSFSMHLGPASGDRFGHSLGVANFGNGPQFDLAIGIPYRAVGIFAGGMKVNAGAVVVLYGSANGLGSPQLWTQDSSGINDQAEPEDRFGLALSH